MPRKGLLHGHLAGLWEQSSGCSQQPAGGFVLGGFASEPFSGASSPGLIARRFVPRLCAGAAHARGGLTHCLRAPGDWRFAGHPAALHRCGLGARALQSLFAVQQVRLGFQISRSRTSRRPPSTERSDRDFAEISRPAGRQAARWPAPGFSLALPPVEAPPEAPQSSCPPPGVAPRPAGQSPPAA